MTAIVVTAHNDIPAALIEITGAPAGAVVISRQDVNGTNDVRLMEGQEPISGALTLYDYEVALQGTATYTVTDSAAAEATDDVLMDAVTPVIMAAALPHTQALLADYTDYDSTNSSEGSIHWVIGRRDPVVVATPVRFREGSLGVLALTYADAKAVEDAAATGEVLMFRQPTYPGMDMYFIPRTVSLRPKPEKTATRAWEVTISYTEVLSPDAALQSAAGWNFDAHTALGLTFAQSLLTFPTFKDRVIGP